MIRLMDTPEDVLTEAPETAPDEPTDNPEPPAANPEPAASASGSIPAAEDSLAAAQEAPTDEPPAQEAPTNEPPAQEAPTNEVRTDAEAPDAATQEAPTDEVGGDAEAPKPPAQKSPVDEPPAQKSPVDEPPAQKSPADEPPAQEAPARAKSPAAPSFGTPIPVKDTTGGLKSGTIVTGLVASVSRREMELDLGEGRVAVIGSRHWSTGLEVDLTGEVRLGDEVSAAVLMREDHKNRIVLSRSWGLQIQAWEEMKSAMRSGKLVTGTVTDASKSGWTVDIGVRAFVPQSLAGSEDPEAMVGKTAEFKVVEVSQPKNRCILSRRAAMRTLERRANRKWLDSLKPGDLVAVRVSEVQGGGAVVIADGKFRSRIRRSELSWSQVRRPGAVVNVGDELEARVLSTTPSKTRIDLSLRTGDDPFARLEKGRNYQGTVNSLTAAGAYVRIDLDKAADGKEGVDSSKIDGAGRAWVEGLVSNEELVEYPIRHPNTVVVPGDTVAVQVLRFNRRTRQLDLSVNRAMLLQPSRSG